MTRRAVLLDGMHGLGDNLYQRPVLRELSKTHHVYLITSWPQLYADLDVKCVRPPNVNLRTQAKNLGLGGHVWHRIPPGVERRRFHYVRMPGSIPQALCQTVGLAPPALDFSGPPLPNPRHPGRPYVVVRPVTVRAEWRADSRNPRPEYVAQAAAALRGAGFLVVSVADLSPGQEWALNPVPEADITYHAGELSVTELLGLVSGASALVGGVGWIVPAAVSYRVPLFLIFGGWGGDNGPDRIFDARMPPGVVLCALPDKFCRCNRRDHPCNKTITDIEARIYEFVSGIVD